MRKATKALGAVAMAAVITFALSACGGSSNVKGPVYLKTKQVYYDTSSGNVQSELSWEYDSRGNKTKRVTKTTSNGATTTIEDTYSDFDQDGYPAARSATNGSEVRDSTYEYTKENGQVVKSVESTGAEVEYTYYDSGQVKTMKTSSASGATTLYEYDESGYLIKSESSGGSNDANRTIMWTMDDDGAPANMVYNSASSSKSQVPVSYTVQCDDNGNIIRVYTSLGKLYEEVEYTKVDSPSLAAWVEGHMISG